MDDQDLLAAVANGDDVALRELFERHAPWVASRLRRGLPVDAVEDVLQETFIAIWKSARGYTGQGEPGAWVWGIARRQAAMWLRAHKRTEAQLDFDAPAGDDPANEAMQRAEVAQALAALGADGTEQRELARLAWEEDLSMSEVAARMGIPQGTVKSRLHRLRQMVRTALR